MLWHWVCVKSHCLDLRMCFYYIFLCIYFYGADAPSAHLIRLYILLVKVLTSVVPTSYKKPLQSVGACTEERSNWVLDKHTHTHTSTSLKMSGWKLREKSLCSKAAIFLLFLSLNSCVCVCVCVCIYMCGSTSYLPPPCQGAPLSLPLCALALEVTSFGVEQAGTQQEQLSLSLSCWTLREGKKGKGKIKNSPVMWSAEPPPEDSWHNNLNDQMIQRRLVSWETAS